MKNNKPVEEQESVDDICKECDCEHAKVAFQGVSGEDSMNGSWYVKCEKHNTATLPFICACCEHRTIEKRAK